MIISNTAVHGVGIDHRSAEWFMAASKLKGLPDLLLGQQARLSLQYDLADILWG